MRRRVLVASVVGGAVVAGAAASRWGGDESDESETARTDQTNTEPPFSLIPIDSGPDDSIAVPPEESVGVVTFARTNCPTTRDHLAAVATAAHRSEAETDDPEQADSPGDEVRYIGVVQTARDPATTTDEFARWWNETDATWPIGLDESGSAFTYYEATAPTTVYFDASGTETARHVGSTSPEAVRNGIESARDP